jgi:anti-sigma factor ChrR (cupin superfamily)
MNNESVERDEEALLAQLAAMVDPVAPRPEIRGRLVARIASYEALKPAVDIRPYDAEWIPAGEPGVEMRKLYRNRDAGLTTMMLRMAPGARLPAHTHGEDEQCLVISGDVRSGEVVYRAGDFVVMGKGSHHPEICTEDGNVLLLIAGRNEYI